MCSTVMESNAFGYFHGTTTGLSSPFGHATEKIRNHAALPGGAMLALPVSARKYDRRSSSLMRAAIACCGVITLRTRDKRTLLIMALAPRASAVVVSPCPKAGLRT